MKPALTRRLLGAVSTALALSLAVSSCSAVDGFIHGTTPTAIPSSHRETAPTPDLQSYYSQPLNLVECNGKFSCGNITVPLDYASPKGATTTIAVVFAPATSGKAQGSILFNPGGPGASGVQWIKDGYEQLGTARLRKNYNIIGFDPRGVGGSSPVQCLNPKQTDQLLYGVSGKKFGSKADLEFSVKSLKTFAAACQKNSTKILPHVDTVSAARDLDIIRTVFGDKKLNYLGYSYGSLLGLTYATLFSKKVGHLVLDGIIDPTMTQEQQSVAQLKGFDYELKAYLSDCLKNSDQTECPFSGSRSKALATVKAFLAYLETHNIKTDDKARPLTLWGATTGMMMALYSQDYWPYLSQAFDEALNSSRGTMFLALADSYNDRDEKGQYLSNTLEANVAIGCLDGRSPSDMASMVKQNKRMLKVSGTLGRYWSYGALQCSIWPYVAVEKPSSYAATGSAPILVVGTTGDPATPYAQAVHVANEVLENAQLVTFEGDGHTAYGRSNSCVADAVDNYFIDSIVPSKDPKC
jgi:pimeloyl-ACP methyl ester carboxylesterase